MQKNYPTVRLVGVLIMLCLLTFLAFQSTHRKTAYGQFSSLTRSTDLQPFNPEKEIDAEHPLVLFFFCGCSPCNQTARRLSSLIGDRNQRNLLCVLSISPQDTRDFTNRNHCPG